MYIFFPRKLINNVSLKFKVAMNIHEHPALLNLFNMRNCREIHRALLLIDVSLFFIFILSENAITVYLQWQSRYRASLGSPLCCFCLKTAALWHYQDTWKKLCKLRVLLYAIGTSRVLVQQVFLLNGIFINLSSRFLN